MSHDLDDTMLSAWASHMLRLHHGRQSALSYPFILISSPLSFFPAPNRHQARRWFHPPSRSVSDSLPLTRCLPPAVSLASDYCLFIQKPNPRLEGCTIFAENEETQIHHVLPPPLCATVHTEEATEDQMAITTVFWIISVQTQQSSLPPNLRFFILYVCSSIKTSKLVNDQGNKSVKKFRCAWKLWHASSVLLDE